MVRSGFWRRSAVTGCLVVAVALSVCADPAENRGSGASEGRLLALVFDDNIAALGPTATIIHHYDALSLVRLEGDLPVELGNHIHVLPATDLVGFRSWSGSVSTVRNGSAFYGGVLILDLIGPMDRKWRERLESAGVEILASADPHALVVRTNGAGIERAMLITTSEGFPIVRGIGPLPVEARVHRLLVPALGGGVPSDALEVRISGFGGRPLSVETKRAIGGGELVRLIPGELARLLIDHPEVGYVEPVFGFELHNNLAARAGLVAVEPVWDLGYNGEGVTVSHNDSGVDLDHPDLAGSVTAAIGRMAYSDTAHGTHTAGSIAGRGSFPSPVNTSGCGDLTAGLPSVRGMAWGAQIVTNNIFEEGFGQVADMMAWGVRNGAHLSSNSWGLVGLGDPAVGYTTAAVKADAAVRDADPDLQGMQPLAIFFSAGNVGPDPGTVTSPATAKNVITIGAVQNDRCGAWVPAHQGGPDPDAVLTSSGRGPSQGRIKPDLVAPGSDVLSVESSDSYAVQLWDEDWTGSPYAINTGTSQACAVAAGGGAVLHEFLWRTRGRRPSPALLKAALIVAADGGEGGLDFNSGWGRVDLKTAVRGPETGSIFFMDSEETAELVTGEVWSAPIVVHSSASPIDLAVVWTDVPGEEDADYPLVNDLDLVLASPNGTVYRGNVFSGPWSSPDPETDRDSDNNVEVVRVEFPEVGTWIVDVVGVNVPETPVGLEGQDFALVYSGDAGPCAEPPPAPATVEASHLGDNRILVTWSAVSGATRYEVSRSLVAGGDPYLPITTVAAGVTSFLDMDVSGGSDYHYVVRTYRYCWSAYSAEASATGTGLCRLAPDFDGVRSVEDPGGATCALELIWEPAVRHCPGIVAYDIYRGEDPGFEPAADNLVLESLVARRWQDRGLVWGHDHYYVVRARHLGQQHDDGNTVERSGRPSGPDDVYLREDVEGVVDGWILEQGSEADTGTEPWRVTEDDAWAGERAWFVADEDRVKDQVLVTAEPIALAGESTPILEFRHRYRLHNRHDGGRLEYSTNGGLEWFDILDGDGQIIPADPDRWQTGGYVDTIGSPSSPLFRAEGWTGDSRGWVHSVVDLAVFAGHNLLLRWRLGCDDTAGLGFGWWLDEIRLVVEHPCQSCLASDPPSGLVAEATTEGVMLEWNDVWMADEYRVSRSTKPEGPFQHLATVLPPETTYHDTAASGGSSYTYVVVVVEDDCRSDHSQGVTVTAGGPCGLAPTFWGLDGVTDLREAGCALDLEWRPASPGCSGADVSYRVYRSPSPDFVPGPDTLIADGVSGVRYRDTTIADGVEVHYRVRAVDGTSLAEETNPVMHSGWTTGPEEVHFSDSVEGGLEAWWTGVGSSQDSGTDPWEVVDDLAHSGSRSWFCRNEPRVKDQVLGLTSEFMIVDDTTVLSFYHQYDLEPFWDGGRFEYSTNGGSSWQDILEGDASTVGDNPDRFISGAYTGFVSVGTGHPFGGERAWTGFDTGWTETVVNLADFVGLAVQFRWRLGCDRSDARVGWWVDDVELRTTTKCEKVELPPPRSGAGRRP